MGTGTVVNLRGCARSAARAGIRCESRACASYAARLPIADIAMP
jgi:hypothetical protein